MTMYCLFSQAVDSWMGRHMFDLTVSKDGMTFSDPNFCYDGREGLPDEGIRVWRGCLAAFGRRLPNG
jgi:hypothetical protein